jgi:ComF family protein
VKSPPPFRRAFAPFVHFGAVARAIHRFKYEDHPELSAPLGRLLSNEAKVFLSGAPGLVCPIPLNVKRYHSRRYDQAALLAKEIAAHTGRDFKPTLLERSRDTPRQVGLSDTAREQNVAGAFAASREAWGGEVLLIDDVFTTGATARVATQALLDQGARRVEVLTLARASRVGS